MTTILITIGSIYLFLCMLLFLLQEYMLFPGSLRSGSENIAVPEGVEIERLTLEDGTSYRVAVAAPDRPRGVLAWFVGNGEDLTSGVRWAAEFRAYGLKTIVTEYPGYGTSGGKVGMTSILAAAERSAREAYGWRQQLGVPLFLGGISLGSFSAVHAAALGLGDKLLLASPPTSIAAAGAQRYPFLPVRWLLRHPFDNLGKADQIKIPTLIIHGDRDSIVPHEMGARLAEEIDGAELVTARGVGHNNLSLHRAGPFGTQIEKHLFE